MSDLDQIAAALTTFQNNIPGTGDCFDVQGWANDFAALATAQNACIATFQVQLNDLQDQITLCCSGANGGNGGGEAEFTDTWPQDNVINNAGVTVGYSSNLSDSVLQALGVDTCLVTVTGSLQLCAFNTGSPQSTTTMTRQIELLCNGTQVDSVQVTHTWPGTFTECTLEPFELSHQITNQQGCFYTIRLGAPAVTCNDPNNTGFCGPQDAQATFSADIEAQCS